MAELTREQVESFRDGLPIGGRSNPVVGMLCDLALRTLDSGQREAKLVEALKKIADDYPRSTNEGAQAWAREALREYDERPK